MKQIRNSRERLQEERGFPVAGSNTGGLLTGDSFQPMRNTNGLLHLSWVTGALEENLNVRA